MIEKTEPFKVHSWCGKSYNLFGEHLRNRFSHQVLKIPINAGFSCPNRDGTLGSVGCTFCSEDGSSAQNIIGIKDIIKQMDIVRSKFRRSTKETQFISYLQSYTNTHAPTHFLKQVYGVYTGESVCDLTTERKTRGKNCSCNNNNNNNNIIYIAQQTNTKM